MSLYKIKCYLEDYKKENFKQEDWPYFDLWAAMIISEVREKEVLLFKSDKFKYICDTIGIDENVILRYLPLRLKKLLREVK